MEFFFIKTRSPGFWHCGGGTFFFARISSPVASPRRQDSAKQLTASQSASGASLDVETRHTQTGKNTCTQVFLMCNGERRNPSPCFFWISLMHLYWALQASHKQHKCRYARAACMTTCRQVLAGLQRRNPRKKNCPHQKSQNPGERVFSGLYQKKFYQIYIYI